jgi:3'(2'), 5'-bisphosphate nucleotidase
MNEQLLNKALLAAYEAGKAILPIYNTDIGVTYKDDKSPLTAADTASNEVIKEHLGSDLPILSEEGKLTDYATRREWTLFWLIDPLDGTKEFIKKNGEFTINIALIENGVPVLGVVYVPVSGIMYFGMAGLGSFLCDMNLCESADLHQLLQVGTKLKHDAAAGPYIVVASRSHMTPETENFIREKQEAHGSVELISSGSSIKLCLVAEGKANIYPRLAPTMEWDTAAAHAVAKYAGCSVYSWETNMELTYNKENLLNPWFIVERI